MNYKLFVNDIKTAFLIYACTRIIVSVGKQKVVNDNNIIYETDLLCNVGILTKDSLKKLSPFKRSFVFVAKVLKKGNKTYRNVL